MRLSRVVEAVSALSATSSRTAKTELVAGLLCEVEPGDARVLVGLLLGRPRQGRIGLGWRSLVSARESVTAATDPTLTVADVDDLLERYAVATGSGSAAVRAGLVAELFGRATADEQDLLVRTLTGEVRTGALEGVVVDGLARAVGLPLVQVRRAVMLSGSLGSVAEAGLRDPESLAAVGLSVGTPVQPMLASTAADVAAALAITGEASVEHKLDGARIQVHRSGDEVSVHTRSLADVTARVPEIVEVVRALPVEQVVLDGETLMLDDAGTPRPFQETMSRFGTQEVSAPAAAPTPGAAPVPDASAARRVLAPRFFDVLHLDGRDLLDEPLRDRLAILRTIAPDHVIPGEVTTDPVVGQRILDESLAAGHEGVLVKGVDTAYTAGRRGRQWVKVKPVHTHDLVVLAAEWGSGRRQGWLSNLHLGARDPDGAFGEPGGYVMVGKTFKGLTDELLRWQTETFPHYEVRRTRGTVWLRPEIVVEIAIDGVQRSSRYPGGIALRFARVKAYRPDKRPAEADTIDSLRGLLRT